MEYRTLGRSGLKVSVVGLGCNMFGIRLDAPATAALVGEAIDQGVTLFDVADVYGGPDGIAERLLGQAVAGQRDGVLIATKGGFGADLKPMGASAGYIATAVEASLRRLKTDYIDLYQIHTPDPRTPIEETLGALDALVAAGKIRHYGASNLAAWQAVDAGWTARHHGWHGYVSVQNEYNLLSRGNDAELLPALDAAGMSLIPYFPLASGLLTGKYRANAQTPPESRLLHSKGLSSKFMAAPYADAVERLASFAEAHGRTLTELAMSWLAAKPQVSSIIAGATSIAQLRDNVASVRWRMTAGEMETAEWFATGPEL
jgi:aryl-alcohol dehydrogenase-like predicted oxidoreductase